MKKRFVSIVLRPNPTSEILDLLPKLFAWLTKRKITVALLERDHEKLSQANNQLAKVISPIGPDELHLKSDLIISLGGDGTLLGVCRLAQKNTAPIFGVNFGKLGFITEFTESSLWEGLELFFKKPQSFKIPFFNAVIKKGTKVVSSEKFLNDAVIHKNDISRLFSLSAHINKQHVFNLSGDGLIVSTPIGSTAYSMAAGGPIIYSDVNALTLTPICPHSLTHRPLVLPDKETIELKLLESDEAVSLTLDGQRALPICSDHRIYISKSTNSFVNLVKNPQKGYFQTLRDKFTHGKY